MAKYTITHSCGHSQTHQLYGPMDERDRTIAYRESQPCTSCWSAAKRQEDDAAGPLITFRRIQGRTGPAIEIIATRSTYRVKDTLKARGYRYGEYMIAQGVMDLLARGDKGWARVIPCTRNADIKAEADWCKSQGWEMRVQDTVSTMMASLAEGRPDLLPPG